MFAITMTQIVSTLQVAISPVILISGVGLLLLTLNNRFGHVIDRARLLLTELRTAVGKERAHVREQIDILYRRARFMRCAVSLAAMTVLLATLLIITLFVAELLGLELALVVSLLFILALAALVGALAALVVDIHLSLAAIKLELTGESLAKLHVPAEEEQWHGPRKEKGAG